MQIVLIEKIMSAYVFGNAESSISVVVDLGKDASFSDAEKVGARWEDSSNWEDYSKREYFIVG